MNKENLKDLILIQNKYRFITTQLKSLDKQLSTLKKCLVSMSDNLLYLNEKKYYDNLNYNFEILIEELKLIKNKIDKLPDSISFKVLKDNTLSDLSFQVCEISMLVLKYMNHIAPNNLFLIFDLFFGVDKLYDNITRNDII